MIALSDFCFEHLLFAKIPFSFGRRLQFNCKYVIILLPFLQFNCK